MGARASVEDGVRKANIGCGSVVVPGWDNYDIARYEGVAYLDIRDPRQTRPLGGAFDVIVAHHVLSALDHHELPVALRNVRQMLSPGGVLRVSVPDVEEGFRALQDGDKDWFPQDDKLPDLDARFCTWATWFGTHKSVFTEGYLRELLYAGGFSPVMRTVFGRSEYVALDATELDTREGESLFMEGIA